MVTSTPPPAQEVMVTSTVSIMLIDTIATLGSTFQFEDDFGFTETQFEFTDI